jgi:hypothetical protein
MRGTESLRRRNYYAGPPSSRLGNVGHGLPAAKSRVTAAPAPTTAPVPIQPTLDRVIVTCCVE